MKLSARLRSCADLVRRGNTAADVGTDHGYLSIYLLQEGICRHVYASDLREMPLAAAKRNAARAGIGDQITFCLSDGLAALPMERIGTVICAGMGGDNMIEILKAAPAVREGFRQLILQPQSAVSQLRKWLTDQGFSIRQEKLSRDGKFIYTAMEVYFGDGRPLTPGQQYMPPWLLASGDPLMPDYFRRVKDSVRQSVEGLRRAKRKEQAVLDYYEAAWTELTEMEEQYGIRI